MIHLRSLLILGSTWAWPTTTSTPRGKFSLIAGGPVGEFEATFPNHRTIELPNADHFFFEDVREQMIPEMVSFMGAR